MSIALDLFCFAVPLRTLSAAELSVATGVGGCGCFISMAVVRSWVPFLQLLNWLPISASVADARTFRMMPHSTWMGPLRAGIFVIGLSDLGPKKKYPPYRLRALGSDKYDASL
eukprot:scaffold37188_cov29-Attheya_sp.AAC.1